MYQAGKYDEANDYRGWFVGDFLPEGHPAKTDKVEIVYAIHKVGDEVKKHKHNIKVELVIILSGRAKYEVNGEEIELTSGSYLFIQNGSEICATFLEPTTLFAIHAPSLPTDKVVLE